MSMMIALGLDFSQCFACDESQQNSLEAWPVFLAKNGVHGNVNINYGDASSVPLDTDVLKVSLVGFSRVRMPHRGHLVLERVPTYAVLKLLFLDLVSVSPVTPGQVTNLTTGQVAIDFHFDLPSVVSYFQEFSPHNSRNEGLLPSSLSAKSNLSPDANGKIQMNEAKILYRLSATIFRSGKELCSTSKEIRIFNDLEPQPPTCVSDFLSEYLCQQDRALRKNMFMRTGTFSAKIAEPAPFLFCDGNNTTSTRLPISFVIHTPVTKDPTNAMVSPGEFKIHVTWRLKSLTFMSILPMGATPTVLSAERTSSATVIKALGLHHQLKLTLSRWNTLASCCNEYDQRSFESWSAEEQFPLLLSHTILPTPTLMTPYISRRYSLLVHIKVVGNGKTSLKLEVPVQIVYSNQRIGMLGRLPYTSQRSPNEHIRQVEEDDTVKELPVYVP